MEKKIIMSLWLSVIPIFIIGSLLHFVYKWSGENRAVALIAPVNESVWEHLKLLVIPVLISWVLLYYKYSNINLNVWITALMAALLGGIIIIPMLFYFYTQAFGIESVIIDIIIFFIACVAAQAIGIYVYKNGIELPVCISSGVIAVIIVSFIVFTISPPDLPIFTEKGISN